MTKLKWAALAIVFALLFAVSPAKAGVICSLPFNLQNGTTADATQVMANYNTLVTCLSNAAAAGTNNDITSLLGLTTPLSFTEGGSSVFIGGTATVLSNVYTVPSTTPAGFTLTKGFIVSFVPPASNTGPTQISVGGQATTNLFRQTPSGPLAMTGGEVQANQVTIAYYDGTQFQCLNCAPTAIVPTGTTLDFAGVVVPAGFALANGQSLNRTTFSVLWNTLAYTNITATASIGSTTIVVPSTANFQVGWYVGASANITCNSAITSITDATHVVINNAATSSGSPTISVGPYQQGDCSTNFNVPNYVGKFLAGVDGTTNITTTTCPNPASIGDKQAAPNTPCGGQTQTLTAAQIPTINVTVTSTVSNIGQGSNIIVNQPGTGSATNYASLSYSAVTSTGSSTNTSGAAHPILPPAALVYKIIKT